MRNYNYYWKITLKHYILIKIFNNKKLRHDSFIALLEKSIEFTKNKRLKEIWSLRRNTLKIKFFKINFVDLICGVALYHTLLCWKPNSIQAEEWPNKTVTILFFHLDLTSRCVKSACICISILRRRKVTSIVAERSTAYVRNSFINGIKSCHYKC